MYNARQIALSELEKLKKRLATLKMQAQGHSTLIEIHNAGAILDPLKLNAEAILQAATDLHATLSEARDQQQKYDSLYASLYD